VAKIIKLNSKIYPLEAILSSSYAFTGQAYIHLDGDPKKEIFVRIKNKGRYSKEKSDSLCRDFRNSLIHHVLRHRISKNNKKLREYVVCRALYSVMPDFISSENKVPGELSGLVDAKSIKKTRSQK